MALHLKLGFSNSPSCSIPYCVRTRIELQRVSNQIVPSFTVVEPLRLNNARKLFDKIPKRIRIVTMDVNFSEYTKELEVGIEENSDFSRIDTVDYVLGGQELNGMPILGSSARNVMNRHCVVDFISCCSREGSLELGKLYHALVIKNGLGGDMFVSTSLANMYAKCGYMDNAMILFNEMFEPDIASCNCLISGYLSNGLFDEAFGFFIKIAYMGIRPNHYTYSIMLTVCGIVLAIQEGRQFHAHVVKMQYLSNMPVANALLTMYSKCGMVEEAESLFETLAGRNLVSCTAIISGFYQHKAFEKALGKFCLMGENGVTPNEYTFTIALACCGSMKHLDNGRALHAQVIKKGMVSEVFVGTAIIDMYSEFGEMLDAEKQLQKMGRIASNVSWNALVAGFFRNNKAEEAMEAFHKMVKNDTACNEFSYSITLKACSSLPSLATCKQIHSRIIKAVFETNLYVANSLIEVYAKCGNLEDAEKIFYRISRPDVVSWNSMIKAYAQYGYPMKAIFLFKKMVKEGKRPTSLTFLAVLSACSHSGLVQEGQQLFESMVKDYNIPPEETHYSCMVDLLGRSGQLQKALDFINNLPIVPTAPIWRPLLAACRCHRNQQLAEFVAKHILKIDPNDATVYVTLSNMYDELGRQADAEKQRELMELKELSKEPGCSWIEVKNRTYRFFSGNETFSEMPKVYDRLKQLKGQINDIGYTPNSSIALYSEIGDLNEKNPYHSEKLAVCFGLINLQAGTPIHIFKNLRICSDCHSTMKNISRITQRDIVLRDNYRFHQFKQGSCSCGDFW